MDINISFLPKIFGRLSESGSIVPQKIISTSILQPMIRIMHKRKANTVWWEGGYIGTLQTHLVPPVLHLWSCLLMEPKKIAVGKIIDCTPDND